MATSVITGVVKNPAGTALANVAVRARLLPRPSYLTSSGAELSVSMETTSDATGTYSFTLTRTADITPSDSFYEIAEFIPPRYGGVVKHIIQVGAVGATVLASLVSTPPSPGQAVYLTQAAGDARYVQSPASFGAAGSITTVNPDDAADAGTVAAYARIDHQHAAPAGTPGNIAVYDTAAEGTGTDFARSDHRHSFTALTAVTAGLTITGVVAASTTNNLIVGPVDGTDEGGQITLKGGLNGASTDHADWAIDLFQDQFRIQTGGVVYYQHDISTQVLTLRGAVTTTGVIFPTNVSTSYITSVNNQAGNPYSNGIVITGQCGWAFYHTASGTYRMGFRGDAANTVRYLWNNDNTLLGSAPNDGINTHTLRVVGTVYISSTLQVIGQTTVGFVLSNSQFQTTYDVSGSALYTNANLYMNPAAGKVAISFHPGGVAPQLRVGNSVDNIYVRTYDDGAYSTLTGILVNTSSRKEKQDIEAWPPVPQARGFMAAAPAETALDKVMSLRPSFFRRKAETYLAQLRYAADGEYDPEASGSPHECGRDCDPDQPCVRMMNWKKGSIGLIAEEVYDVLPEAVHLGADGEPEGLDAVALAAAAIAAVQDLKNLMETRWNSPKK